MNSNYDLSIDIEASIGAVSATFSFDPYNDGTDLDAVYEKAIEEIQEVVDGLSEDDENFGIEVIQEEITLAVTDWGKVPDTYRTLENVFDFAEAFAECEQEIEVVEAALECDIQPCDIDEAYEGEYDDDEDFARETADSTGAVDKNANWPMNCIDWEYAAKELMYDYTEHNGYYFRNL